MNEIPRRCRLDLVTSAERLIYDAQQAIEAMPADVRLTEAQNLLTAARNKVADFVDGIPTQPAPPESQGQPEGK